jgi:hypothetical protein
MMKVEIFFVVRVVNPFISCLVIFKLLKLKHLNCWRIQESGKYSVIFSTIELAFNTIKIRSSMKIQHLLLALALPAFLTLTGCETTPGKSQATIEPATIAVPANTIDKPVVKNEVINPVPSPNLEHCEKHAPEAGHDCVTHCAKHKDKKDKICKTHCEKTVAPHHNCKTHCAENAGVKDKICAQHCAQNPKSKAHECGAEHCSDHVSGDKICDASHCSEHQGKAAHACGAEHCEKHGGDMSKCCGAEQKCDV